MTGLLTPVTHKLRFAAVDPPPEDGAFPRVTVVVPFYRESRTAFERSAAGLLAIRYPGELLTVLWLVDSARERDIAVAREVLAEHATAFGGRWLLRVLPTIRPKGRALNTILDEVTDDVVAFYDADTVPDPDQLGQAAMLLSRRGYDIVEASENARGDHSLLGRTLTAQYAVFTCAMHFLQQRLGMHFLPGSSVYFRRSTLAEVGPFRTDGAEENFDWSIRAAAHPLRTGFLASSSDAIPTPDLPAALRQRTRWRAGQLVACRRAWQNPLPPKAKVAVAVTLASLAAELALAPLALWSLLRPRGSRPFVVLLAVDAARIAVASRAGHWRARRIRHGWLLLLPFELLNSVASWRAVVEIATGRQAWHSVRTQAE